MAVDLNRIIQAAAEAALGDQASSRSQQQDVNQGKRKGLTAPRALLVGAGLATAGRLLVRARGGNLIDGLQQRLATFERSLGLSDEEPDDEEYDEEEFDEDEDVEDEPYDEAEEEPEGEYDEEEPEGEYEDEEEPEDGADEEPEPERRSSRRAASGGRRGRR